jgi:hypothetical protein
MSNIYIANTNNKTKGKEKEKEKENMGFTEKQESLVNSSYDSFKQNLSGNSVFFYTV